MSYELRFGTSIMAIQSSVDSTSAYADVDAVVGILNLYRMRLRWLFSSPYLITDMEGDFIVFPHKYVHTFIVATSTMDVVGLKLKERKKEI